MPRIKSVISPELRLAAFLSRPRLTPDQLDTVRGLAPTVDLDQLKSLVIEHHIWPCVYCNVRDHFPTWLSDSSFADLKTRYDASSMQNKGTFSLCGNILRLAKKHNIDIKILKGLPLAFRLYGDITKRHSGDIDLVIQPSDLDAIHLILTRVGFQCPLFEQLSDQQKQLYWRSCKDIAYIDNNGILIELHLRLTSLKIKSTDHYQQALFDGSTGGDNLVQLELIYLCWHGIHTLFHRLKWLTDIALYLELQPETSKQALIKVARELGALRQLNASWVLANRLFDTDVPQSVLTFYQQDAACRFLVSQSVRQLNQPKTTSSLYSALKIWLCRAVLNSSKKENFKDLVSAFRPTSVDLAAMPYLPHRMYFLYYLLRPALLIYRRLSSDR